MKAAVIKEITEQQLNGSEIARKLGVSRQYVAQISGEIGIKPYRKQAKPPYQRKEKVVDPMREQRRKYKTHKNSAARRGIEFTLTFEEWWSLWEPHYHLMGTRKGCMCMCRTLDRGPYALGNVRIDLVQNNGHERKTSNHYKRGTAWMRQPTSTKGHGRNLPDFLNCQESEVEEDPFLYYY